MRVLIFILLISSFPLFNGCSEAGQEEHIVHNKSCTIDIEGMMCEMGCKTTIQNRINELDGVIKGDVDYALAKAFVTYDANKLSCADIISEIESIGDGLYSAKMVEDKDIENAPVGIDGDADANGASVDTYSFEVPNITDLFTQIF